MTNYFELYDLPLSFYPDADWVKKKYYELSRKYHPDRAQQDGSAANTTEVLQMSATINEAFKVFKNSDATMAYILKLKGLLADEAHYALPPSFLMEMMDLNELISELEPGNETMLQQATATMQQHLNQWETAIKQLTDQYKEDLHDTYLLLKIKDYYFRKKYLLRIKERIDKFAAR